MDLIEQLPASAGHTAILVVVDRLSKQGIFILTHDTLTAVQLAGLFILHVFSKHGVPGHVTSDRSSEFVSHFFRSLGTALGMKLHFTSGYHPEGDGQTERVNQTLEQYLCAYCNYQQDNWSELLLLAEFAYNNAPSETTGVSPFFTNKGYHPNLAIHPERDLASNCAREYAVDLGELHDYLKTEMAEAQQRYRAAADTRRMPPPDFTLGESAYVREKYFCTRRPTKKLAEKYLGPYELIAQVGTHSFTLRLPEELRSVHPVFHVSMLEPHTPSTTPNRTELPPAPVEVEGDLEYEIAEILDTKIDKRRRCKLLYYVQWLGYEGTDEEASRGRIGPCRGLGERIPPTVPRQAGTYLVPLFPIESSIVLFLFLFSLSLTLVDSIDSFHFSSPLYYISVRLMDHLLVSRIPLLGLLGPLVQLIRHPVPLQPIHILGDYPQVIV